MEPLPTGSAVGIDAIVKAGRTATFHAVAYDESSNRSDCSTDSISYTNSSVPPAAPVLTGTDPQSPNPETDIRVKGTAPDDTEVRIFNNPSCDGPPLATGSAADLAGDGIEVFVAPGQNELAAESVDGAGDESACSNVLAYRAGLPNDDFADAIELPASGSIDGSTVGATGSPASRSRALATRPSGTASPRLWTAASR